MDTSFHSPRVVDVPGTGSLAGTAIPGTGSLAGTALAEASVSAGGR